VYVWLNLTTIKFYLIKLATNVKQQPSYLMGENNVSKEMFSYSLCKQKMPSFSGQAGWAKMTSPGVKLTAPGCHLTKKVNKAE
jgi:hypothetical protein